MNTLTIQSTDHSPAILFDPSNKIFKITGESRPEDVRVFYAPVIDWLNEYTEELKRTSNNADILFNIDLEYFNSSSAKQIMDIVVLLIKIQKSIPQINLEILWYYEDEEMLQAGEEFKLITNGPFKFIEK